jgi:hypothetical protein
MRTKLRGFIDQIPAKTIAFVVAIWSVLLEVLW